jgi:hypothetical protein
MRGIDARCALAMSRVVRPFDANAALEYEARADSLAEGQGGQDFEFGLDEPPPQFKDERALLQPWNRRWNEAMDARAARAQNG